MAGLLDGLGQFGLGNLEGATLFEAPEQAKEEVVDQQAAALQQEKDFVFDKSFTCPICDKEFKGKTVKVGKAKLVGTDLDLRPKYDGIDMIKYDIILCPHCGYAALTRYYKTVSSFQAKRIKEVISKSFKSQPSVSEIYSYEEALERYKLALANAIVKQAKASEKAYICLKAAWLLRGKLESLDEKADSYLVEKTTCEMEETEFLKNALEGFLSARQAEGFPMCGMDESTVDYLIAVLAMRFEQYDVCAKLVSGIIVGTNTNPRMKEKARDLKDMLMAKIKEQRLQK